MLVRESPFVQKITLVVQALKVTGVKTLTAAGSAKTGMALLNTWFSLTTSGIKILEEKPCCSLSMGFMAINLSIRSPHINGHSRHSITIGPAVFLHPRMEWPSMLLSSTLFLPNGLMHQT